MSETHQTPTSETPPERETSTLQPDDIADVCRLLTLLPQRLATAYSPVVERVLGERERTLSTIAELSREVADLHDCATALTTLRTAVLDWKKARDKAAEYGASATPTAFKARDVEAAAEAALRALVGGEP